MIEHFLDAYQKEKFRKQALLKVERKNAQSSVYRAIDRFSERKGLYLRAISDILRQTTELAMGTLKQLSPPHFLSKPHEQLSACSIPTPTTSINAIHTILKEVNYVSTHLGTLSVLLFSDPDKCERSNVKREFDIGEVIQNVGDALAGVASCAKVELVIYHVEYGLNHLNVVGDEAALRHALLD
ncbi:1816_t:CDS:1, partial [Acaulospora colombiana]